MSHRINLGAATLEELLGEAYQLAGQLVNELATLRGEPPHQTKVMDAGTLLLDVLLEAQERLPESDTRSLSG